MSSIFLFIDDGSVDHEKDTSNQGDMNKLTYLGIKRGMHVIVTFMIFRDSLRKCHGKCCYWDATCTWD